MTDPKPICPRCRGYIPNNDQPGAYPGAMSRISEGRDFEICSACGMDETFLGRGLVPQEAWPLLTDTSLIENADRSISTMSNEGLAQLKKLQEQENNLT